MIAFATLTREQCAALASILQDAATEKEGNFHLFCEEGKVSVVPHYDGDNENPVTTISPWWVQ